MVRQCLNEVRPRRPEQSHIAGLPREIADVSMKSGLEGRNNMIRVMGGAIEAYVSMKSGLEGRNNPETLNA